MRAEAVSRDRACAERRDHLLRLPALDTGELMPPARAALLARAKSTPVVFLKAPEARIADPVAREWRRRLESSQLPGKVLARLFGGFREFPQFLREVLLTDGYVYAREPFLGQTLSEALTPGMLFREPRIVIERGATEILAESDGKGGYVIARGPERGRPARLLLYDRVFVEGAPRPRALHVDIEVLRDELGFDELELERVTDEGVLAKARYGELVVPAVLSVGAKRLELACEIDSGKGAELLARRAMAVRRARSVAALRQVILEQADEDLPFDEPRTEFGQEDGKLRQEWRLAYAQGQTRYRYNEDEYRVFDGQGRPLVPQVCIDFVFDTFERAGGSWYGRKDGERRRTAGRVSFDTVGMENRRSVEAFLELAGQRSDWFELRTVPAEERVPLLRIDRFFSTLYERRAEYVPGDVVVILGLRDDDKFHYHSFFVFESDPLTGMPTWVAANAGRPRVRTWAGEMAPAPKRSLFARARPKLGWLEWMVGGSTGPALVTSQ